MMRAALSLWLFSAVVCVVGGHHHMDHEQDTPLERRSLVTSANKEFAYLLYRKLASHADSRGKNVFFSPKSVSVALAALSAGARAQTHRQIFQGLGFRSPDLTQADVDEAFHTLLDRDNSTFQRDTDEGVGVFIHNTFKANPDFLDVLKKSYLAEGFNVDFTNAAESAATINRYVAEKTHGKIEKLVEGLDESTIMYLISYIFFKGTWESPFDPSETRKAVFRVDQNTRVSVDMMNKEDRFDVYIDQSINTSVLYLPFNSSSSMLLLLPDDMATLEEAISPGNVTKWLKWKKPRTYDIFVPKFSIQSSYKLNDMLMEMGMTDMFGDRADLSGIADGQKLAVSEVVHKATLDVDEGGATASAATGVGIMLMSLRIVPTLRFDRPFMVVVIDRVSEETLFVGKIVNPNQ